MTYLFNFFFNNTTYLVHEANKKYYLNMLQISLKQRIHRMY